MSLRRHELTDESWERISPLLPPETGRRGRRSKSNRLIVNGIVWILETGAPWRDLPKRFGPWKTVYNRFLQWSKTGIWAKVLNELSKDRDDEYNMLDGKSCACSSGRYWGKKNGTECVGHSRGGATTKIHALVDSLGNPTHIELSEGQVHDIKPAHEIVKQLESTTFIADKGYDSDALVEQLINQGCAVVIPPRKNRKTMREYDKSLYKNRSQVEHFFQKIKRNRRIATRYEKLAVTFLAMVLIASVLVWGRLNDEFRDTP